MAKYPMISSKIPHFRASTLQAGSPFYAEREQVEPFRTKIKKLNWPVFLFLTCQLWPCILLIGPLRLSLYRVVLIAMILPCLTTFASGKVKVRLPDIAVLSFAFWRLFALIQVNGVEASAQTFGIEWLETVGPYLLARCYIRDAEDFHNMAQLLFRLVLILMPLAFAELITGRDIARELFAMVCPTTSSIPEQRAGLTRVQSVFDHPILFGAFVGGVLSFAHMVLGYKQPPVRRGFMTAAVAFTATMSLSAGPLVEIVSQGMLLAWNTLFRTVAVRWKVLVAVLAIVTFLVEVVADKSLAGLVARYLTFDDQSYWFRLLIWEYGSKAATDHPLFGVGLNDWPRPVWMGPSIDNFWLYLAVRSGFAAPALLQFALLSIFLSLAFKKGLDERTSEYRTALLITLSGLFLVSWTVHFWDTAYVTLMFLMGSGAWMLNVGTKEKIGMRAARQFRSRYGPA